MLQEPFDLEMLQRIAAQAVPDRTQETEPADVIEEALWSLPGIGAGARVATSFGNVPVEALRRLDPIKTSAGNFLKVQHIEEVRLDRSFLLTHPEAQPIFIPQNGFGPSSPTQNVFVSGGQRVRPTGRFNQSTGKPAMEYLGQGRIIRKLHGHFKYYVIHCAEPCTVWVDGLWVDLEPRDVETPGE